jgi:hypothetical protein
MQAKDLVSILQEYMPDYSRQTLLSEIDYVHKLALGNANAMTKVTDPNTGCDPLLHIATEVTVVADAQKIDRVYKSDYYNSLSVRIVGNTIYFPPEYVGSDYYVRYYRKPWSIETEQSDILIPDDIIDMFEDGVRSRMALKEHGNSDEWTLWRRMVLPKIQRRLNYNYRW